MCDSFKGRTNVIMDIQGKLSNGTGKAQQVYWAQQASAPTPVRQATTRNQTDNDEQSGGKPQGVALTHDTRLEVMRGTAMRLNARDRPAAVRHARGR